MTERELVAAFVLGGSAYGAIEIMWRGHTHWSMLVTGGLCFVCIYLVACCTTLGRLGQYTLCAALITALEFVAGAILNRALGWNVWDYSQMRFNLYGQICARYSLYWFALSVPGCALARLLRRGLLHGRLLLELGRG